MPDPKAAALNTGLAHHQAGRFDEAERIYREILASDPDCADALHLLGLIDAVRGNHQEALRRIRQAIRLSPAMAVYHSNLGRLYRETNRLREAEAAYRDATRLDPRDADAQLGLGLVLKDRGEFDEAAACFRRAVEANPGLLLAQMQLGSAMRRIGRLDEAAACYRRALEIKPAHARAHNNLGGVLRLQGQPDEAIACCRQAVQLEPGYAVAHLNLGINLLASGDLASGWPEYEWRLRLEDAPLSPRCRPLWDGSSLAGRTIMLFPEQGVGDVFHFIRYVPILRQLGAKVLVECSPGMAPILQAADLGIDQLVLPGMEPPPFDVASPLLSLPGLLETTLENTPQDVPYLQADPALVEAWREQIEGLSGFRVGIAWQGKKQYPDDRWRSIPLAQFAPLARVENVTLISLQKGDGAEQVQSVDFPIVDWTDEMDNRCGPFMDTAAIVSQLDLVVTCDSAIAHLAGALGVPVWLALSTASDWRWFRDREDSPWYPTARLFRQQSLGDWNELFERMAAALAETTGTRILPAAPQREEPATPEESPEAKPPLNTQSWLQEGPLRLKRCRYGPMLYLAGDRYIGLSLDTYGEFSQGEMELLEQVLHPGQVVLDVGANIGTHTMFFAQTVGSTGSVYAFEPQRFLFQILCGNAALSGLTNVHARQAALGRQSGTIRVPTPDYARGGNFGGVSLESQAGEEEVPLLTIDQLNLSVCHLIKVDVEGMEGDVLAGADETLRRLRPMLYLENDREARSPALIKQVMDLDYRLYWHLPPLFRPDNFFGETKNLFPNIISANMLAIPRETSQNVPLREIQSPEDRWSTPQ